MAHRSLARALNPLKSRADLPDDLFRPTYQNRLRVIGRHLDDGNYRAVHLLEVEGGILVRATRYQQVVSDLLEFPEQSFRSLIVDAVRKRGNHRPTMMHSPLFPTGYEDFLRALGHQLDERISRAIALIECDDFVFLSGMEQPGGTLSSFAPFARSLREPEIVAMLDDAFHRRSGD